MTTQTTHTRDACTRARRLGALAVAFTALLSPTGKILVGAAAAAALIGGVATQLRAPASTSTQAPQPAVHPSYRLAHAQPSATVHTRIESGGEAIPIVLAEGSPASDGSGEPSAIPGLTFPGLPGGDPSEPGAQPPHFSAPQGGLPALQPAYNTYPPGFSRPGGHLPPPNTQQGTPPGNAAPSGGGAGPQNNGAPNSPPTGSSTGPTQLTGPGKSVGEDASPEETGAPAAPQSGPQTDPNPNEEAATPNAPDSMRQPGTGDPFNPSFPTSDMGPLHTTERLLSQIRQLSRAAVPEPSMLSLMLIGMAALAWKARQRLAP